MDFLNKNFVEYVKKNYPAIVITGVLSSLISIGILRAKKLQKKKNLFQSQSPEDTQITDEKTVRCLGFELGGTSCSLAIGEKVLKYNKNSQKDEVIDVKILEKFNVKTQAPELTLNNLFSKIKDLEFQDVGIAAFGPINLNIDDSYYGFITTTPKIEWQNFPILNQIKNRLPLSTKRVTIDTDVNSCAIAEFKLGNHNVKNSLAYITVGTGVGVGLVINGKSVTGLIHPEGGHQRVTIQNQDKDYEGVCIFHGNCLEGLVTNVSIAKRKQLESVDQLKDLPDSDPVWQIVGDYLGQLCANITYICSPECIVIGGGVMNRSILYDIIRESFKKTVNGYLSHERLDDQLRYYIKEPHFKDTGLIGALIQ